MCEACERKQDKDRAMWEAIRLGVVAIQRGLGAIAKAIEKRYAEDGDTRQRRVA